MNSDAMSDAAGLRRLAGAGSAPAVGQLLEGYRCAPGPLLSKRYHRPLTLRPAPCPAWSEQGEG
jgi:hypothetical protein